MDALITEQIGEWRLEELRRDAARAAVASALRSHAAQGARNRARIRIAATSRVPDDGVGKGRLATRTPTMLQDPFMLRDIGTQRLEALRGEAARHAALRPPVPRWRRAAGYSLVRVGLRLLSHPAPADVLERATPASGCD